MTWLTKVLGIDRWLLLLVAVLAVVALFGWLAAREAADDRGNREVGAQAERTRDLETTIERVETADATRAQVEDDFAAGGSDELYNQCLRTARTPTLCERFLLGGTTAESRACPRSGC